MKKKFLTFCFLISFFSSFSQTHNPINYYNSGWNILSYKLDSITQFPGIIDQYRFYFYGDSVINSNYYHKCFYNFKRHNFSLLAVLPDDSGHYVGSLRNNGLLYYFLPRDSSNERLIYNFNLAVGDTVPLGYSVFQNKIKILGFTDSLTLLDNSIRTKYYYYYYDSSGFVSGGGFYYDEIGDISGLIDSNLYEKDHYSGGVENYSYCVNGNMKFVDMNYHFAPGYDCAFPVIVAEHSEDIERLIYPNPTTGIINIKSRPNGGISLIKIINLFGEILIETHINNANSNQLDLSSFESGLYYLSIETEDRFKFMKIFKD